MPGRTKCCTCHAKSSQQTWRSDAPKCNPSQEISALLTAPMKMSLVLMPRKMHLCRSSSNVPLLPSFLEMLQNPHVLLTFDKVHNPLRLPRESTSERPKVVRTRGVFNILTSKCASRHNGVHFFDIATSKSGSKLVCFVHFDFEMCFAPQWRALFRFFSTSQLPRVVRTWWVLYILTSKCASRYNGVHFFDISTSKSGPELVVLCILTSKCASRHNGVHFFISHLARWLRTRRFSEPTFRPSEPQISGKTQRFATFLPFRASASSFFWLFLFSDLLSSTVLFSLTLSISAFHLFILSEAWLLNYLRWGEQAKQTIH